MKRTILRVITGAYAVILTACAPATTAFANTGKEAECICSVRCEKKINDTCPACREDVALCQGTPKVEDERDEKKDDQVETDGKPLTPDGNLNLIDDYGTTEEDKSGKQFLTFTTKNGNYFYMIVDRDDSGNETVHFLNMVDESDLLALMDDDEKKELGVETDQEKEEKEKKEAEEREKKAAEQKKKAAAAKKKKQKKSPNGALVLLLLVGFGGIGIYAYKKFGNKDKNDGGPDPDADYSEDDSDYIEQLNQNESDYQVSSYENEYADNEEEIDDDTENYEGTDDDSDVPDDNSHMFEESDDGAYEGDE